MSNLLLPEGILIGHANTAKTGVTAILALDGAVGGVDVKGCAPGTRETDLLRAEKAIQNVNGIVLCGGSAYGLGAIDGVIKYLKENKIGHKMGELVVPLVAGAVIFDLNENEYNYPDFDMGYTAAKTAKNTDIKWGNVGAGTGATIGKILGAGGAAKGGISYSTVNLGGVFVTAITVLNALGDVYDFDNGAIVSGATLPNGNFLDTRKTILSGNFPMPNAGGNTTLSCVITNAKLSKLQCNKLASICHDGYAQAIAPVHTDYDGDTIFALSRGDTEFDFTVLSVMAVEAVRQSIINAAKAAK